MATDPSQQEAEPLPSVSAGALLSRLKAKETAEADPSDSPEAKANRQQAADELAAIFELRDSRAFQWFETAFIEKPYREAFTKLRDPYTPVEELPDVRTRYIAMRALKVAILEREIAHRQLIHPQDEELPRLRERLSLL